MWISRLKNFDSSLVTGPLVLATIGLVYYVILLMFGKLSLKLGIGGDEYSYLVPVFEDFSHYWGGYRTLGYPVFLNVYSKLDPTYASLPHFCYIAFTVSTVYLYTKIRFLVASNSLALLFCLCLMLSPLNKNYDVISTETIGISLLALTLASFVSCFERTSVLRILTLSLLTFLCWNLRPSLIAIVPALVLAFSFGYVATPSRSRRRTLFLVLLGTIIPLVAFLGLRFATVGHFGITSFTGFGLASHATMLLKESDLTLVRERSQEISREILRRKIELIDDCNERSADATPVAKKIECSNEMGMVAWLAVIEHMRGVAPLPELGSLSNPWDYPDYLPLGSLSTFFTQHHDPVIERALMQYSIDILRINKDGYFRWILAAFRNLYDDLIKYLSFVVLSTAFIAHFISPAKLPRRLSNRRLHNIATLGAFSLVFYIISYVISVVIYVPLPRYNDLGQFFWNAYIFVAPVYLALYLKSLNRM